tara:strand:- start:6398 stop:6757 length:360 start_codon:yes stop_codon:yes gene_type:complete
MTPHIGRVTEVEQIIVGFIAGSVAIAVFIAIIAIGRVQSNQLVLILSKKISLRVSNLWPWVEGSHLTHKPRLGTTVIDVRRYFKILLAAGVGVLFFLAGGSIACELDKLDCGETIEESF